MRRHQRSVTVSGPWSLATSKAFWEGFAPTALPPSGSGPQEPGLEAVFLVEADWSRARARVTQDHDLARITVEGDGDLDSAATQVGRFLALDVDARPWPAVADRDPVIADAQARLPGLRPCGFHSPYEAAAWAVLSQRIRIIQAARLCEQLVHRHGDAGAFPAPHVLRTLDLDLPGRKTDYLHAVADAALNDRLDGLRLRRLATAEAIRGLQDIPGIGPFAAELVLLRGANATDALPRHERRLNDEISLRYGPDADPEHVARAWQPFRTWAAVHLRALREARIHEIAGPRPHGS